jgi:transcriptional regulator with XRE-family HTH domain
MSHDEDRAKSASLGQIIKKARMDLGMSQRDVEEATEKEISNAYLSQLESGKIQKPSPHILHSLSNVLSISYETLMERAGYIVPTSSRPSDAKHGHVATFAVDNLSAEEESALLEYLEFIRSKKR